MKSIYSFTTDELAALFSSGEMLDQARVDECIRAIDVNPQDFIARLKLAGFCSPDFDNFKYEYFRHLLWFIDNYPDVPFEDVLSPFRIVTSEKFCYTELFESIRRHVELQPNNVKILVNAAYLCMHLDDPFAIICARKARDIAPTDPRVNLLVNRFSGLIKAWQNTGLSGHDYGPV